MAVEIRIAPTTLTINRGSTFMVTDLRGEIDQLKPQGLFAEDTRFISTYQFFISQQPWTSITAATLTYYAARLEFTNPKVLTPDGRGEIEEHTIAFTLDRQINAGLAESFHIVNYSLVKVDFVLEVVMRADFADLFEVKAGRLTRRGDIDTILDTERNELVTSYRNEDFVRRVVYRVNRSSSKARYANGRLAFHIELEPGQAWDARCEALLQHQGRRKATELKHGTRRNQPIESHTQLDRYQKDWIKSCTVLNAANDDLRMAYQQAVEDMGALRIHEHDLAANVWLPAAGLPWFVALFGRDSLTVSYQSMMLRASFAQGALRELANYQAQVRDDWRDAQPGKIPHELRHGELAHFHLVPHTPYYGTADATILYLIVLHEYYKWSGDRNIVKELREVAEKCVSWIDEYGDLDGDGFQEYKTFSNQGYDNMGWKDAGDAIVYRDGSQVQQPKALCELQGYVYDAKLRMAEISELLGDGKQAQKLRQEASDLQQRFDDRFWMPGEGCYALGLDPAKQRIDAVASNMGQCLWSGIVPVARAKQVVQRLLRADMWCGWGIRTLSAKNPAYNPYSYQRGSVWPHDNGIIAAGMKRYGFADEANKVAEGIFAAAAHFDSHRLPEVFAGREREPLSFPAEYIGANIPQAWATGSIFHLIQTILGLRADAPNGALYVWPTLPDWLPEVELKNVDIGKDQLDLRFWRAGTESRFEVVRQRGETIEVKPEGPERPVPTTATTEERHTARD
jgi:glycogen debranching enzyme